MPLPLPDMATLTAIAKSMRADRQGSADRQLQQQADAANTALQMQGRQMQAIDTARQDEISQRAQAMQVREAERAEDRDFSREMMGRQQGFAREGQLREMAFKYQKAGMGMRGDTGTSPRLPGSQALNLEPGQRPGAPARTYTGPGGEQRPVRHPMQQQYSRDMLPMLFEGDPAQQVLAQKLWDQGEFGQVEDMVGKAKALADPRRERNQLADNLREINNSILRMEEQAKLYGMDEYQEARLDSMRGLFATEEKRYDDLVAQEQVMTNPDLKRDITDIRKVPPAELKAVRAAVDQSVYVDSGKPIPDASDYEYIWHVVQGLRASGYDIQLVAQRGQALLPSEPPPPDQVQAKAPVDYAARAAAMSTRHKPGDYDKDQHVGLDTSMAPKLSPQRNWARGLVKDVKAYATGDTEFQRRNVDALRPAMDWSREAVDEAQEFWFAREGYYRSSVRDIFGPDRK